MGREVVFFFASPAVCAGLCWRSFECVGSRSLERLHRGLRGRAQNRGTKQGHPKWLLIFCTLEAAVDGSLSTAWVVSADGCSSFFLNNAWRSWPTKLRFVRKSVAKSVPSQKYTKTINYLQNLVTQVPRERKCLHILCQISGLSAS